MQVTASVSTPSNRGTLYTFLSHQISFITILSEEMEPEIESGKKLEGGIVNRIRDGIPSVGAEIIAPIGVLDFSKSKFVNSEFSESVKKDWARNFDVVLYQDGTRWSKLI